jgi:hypothetical protein
MLFDTIAQKGLIVQNCYTMHIFLILYWLLNTERVLNVGFEVLTAVVMKSSVFWDISPCSLLKVSQHLEGMCHPHLSLSFYPEVGRDIFLWNVGWLSADYTALYPRRFQDYICYVFFVVIKGSSLSPEFIGLHVHKCIFNLLKDSGYYMLHLF